MEENNTIIQLNDALGELLDAYDTLKSENQKLEEIIENKSDEIAELTQRNNELQDKVDSLTTTTKHHSSELDTMLGRIKSTLSSFDKKNNENTTVAENNIAQEVLEENEDQQQLFEEEKEVKEEEPETPKKEGSKEIDLGRMQSLLNGFNN